MNERASVEDRRVRLSKHCIFQHPSCPQSSWPHCNPFFCCNLSLEDEFPSGWQVILGFHVGFLAESLGETKLNNMDTFQHVVSLDFD